jgi:hypothetical protein
MPAEEVPAEVCTEVCGGQLPNFLRSLCRVLWLQRSASADLFSVSGDAATGTDLPLQAATRNQLLHSELQWRSTHSLYRHRTAAISSL